jgi:hypothetical protein
MNQKTPVAFFSYNRPDHAGRVLESLARCRRLDECRAYLYCDGPKGDRDRAVVEASRQVVREWASKLGSEMIVRSRNLGLAKSIVTGVTDLCREYGRVIVIEDDLILSPDFIDYMLQALDRYQDAPQVYQISGYMFPVKLTATTDAVFLPLTTTWGWATWERAWRLFDWQAVGALEALSDPAVQRRFDLDDAYPYSAMLRDRLAGKNDSWGILWWWTVFKRDGLALHPRHSLVSNRGFDGSGVHCGERRMAAGAWHQWPERLFQFPDRIVADGNAFHRLTRFLESQRPRPGGVRAQLRHHLSRFFTTR